MSSIIVPHLYDQVIQKTIKKVETEFQNHGVGHSVIDELNSKWRSKLHQPSHYSNTVSRVQNIQQPQPQEEEEEDEYADHAQNFYNYQVDGQVEITLEQVDGDYHNQQNQQNPYFMPALNIPIAPNPTLQMPPQKHDLSDSDSDEEDVRDKILCQFEKVNRSKNRWKTNFKDGNKPLT